MYIIVLVIVKAVVSLVEFGFVTVLTPAVVSIKVVFAKKSSLWELNNSFEEQIIQELNCLKEL